LVKGPDPEGLLSPWDLNPYVYGRQSPTVYWDPTGLAARDGFPGSPTGGTASEAEQLVDRIDEHIKNVDEALPRIKGEWKRSLVQHDLSHGPLDDLRPGGWATGPGKTVGAVETKDTSLAPRLLGEVGLFVGTLSIEGVGLLASRIGGTTNGLATTIRGAGDAALLARVRAGFARSGGVIDQSAGAQAYLRLRGAEGLTLNATTVLLGRNPSRSAIFEEMIHVGQFRHGRITSGSVLKNEIEAAERLIQNRRAWGIPNAETRATIERLRSLRGE
jgi:hypothetical protein